MPDDKKTPPAASDTTKAPDDKKTPPAADAAAEAKLARQEELTKLWGLNGKTNNLTRDSVIDFEKARFLNAGKTAEEATQLAVKRGFEVIPE